MDDNPPFANASRTMDSLPHKIRPSSATIFDDPSFLAGLFPMKPEPEASAPELSRLRELVQAARTPTFANDLELKHEWKACRSRFPSECQMFAAIVDSARARIERLRAMNIIASPPTLKGELALLAGARCLPANYHPSLGRRVRTAQARLERWQVLDRLLTSPVSDLQLVRAWEALAEVGGQTLLPSEHHERIALAIRRMTLLRKLQAIEALSDYERFTQLVSLWDDTLLHDCADAEALRRDWLRAKEALSLVARLDRACRDNDEAALAQLLSSPHEEHLMLPDDMLARVEELRQRFARC